MIGILPNLSCHNLLQRNLKIELYTKNRIVYLNDTIATEQNNTLWENNINRKTSCMIHIIAYNYITVTVIAHGNIVKKGSNSWYRIV